MKKVKLIFTFLIVVTILTSYFAVTAPSVFAKKAEVTEDSGIFQQVNIDGVKADVYSYTAPVINNPAPMMTPVIFVYSNHGYQNQDDAYVALVDMGLKEIADTARGGVFLLSPENGDSWSEEDVTAYWNIIAKITKSSAIEELGYFTYTNLVYAIGEGNGATFIHNVLSQNANRIAGVATFGGEIDNPENLMALPAYLVGANDDVINFYKSINEATEETMIGENQCFYNSTLDVKKVIINESADTRFNKELIKDAWVNLLRKTTRNVIEECIWYIDAILGRQSQEIFTLMDRAVYSEEKLIFNEINYVMDQSGYFEWVPEEALAEDNTKTYPLVVTFHGSGDHPVFEAESQGWVKLAGKERFIVIAPGNNAGAGAQKALIEEVCAKYPVDKSRIYCTGFSMGGVEAEKMVNEYPELFAAVAPMAAFPEITYSGNVQLPIFYGLGEKDIFMTRPTDFSGAGDIQYTGESFMDPEIVSRVINPALRINGIDKQVDSSNLNFVKYPFVGFDIEALASETKTITTKHGIQETISDFKNDADVTVFKYVTVADYDHNHYEGWAEQIWNFFKPFSRNTETNELIISTEGSQVETNKTALAIAIEMAENASLENVVPAVVEEFNAALENAQIVYDKDNATQEEVDNAFTRLANAMHMLEFFKGNKELLQKQVDLINDLESDKYIESTWNAMTPALEKAEGVLGNENAMQEEVDEVYSELVRAFINLRLKPNKDLLSGLINQANGLNKENYSAASLKAVDDVMVKANLVLNNPEATQEEVEAAVAALTKVLSGLEVSPSNPIVDNKPVETVKPGDTTVSVKTGDTTNLLYPVAGMLLASFVLTINKKRKNLN